MEKKVMTEQEKVAELFEAYKREGQSGIQKILQKRNEEYRAELADNVLNEAPSSEETSTGERPQEPSIYEQVRNLSRGTRSGRGFADLSSPGPITLVFPRPSVRPKDPSQS